MWKLRRIEEGTFLVLKLSGRVEEQGLSELRKACAAAGNAGNVALDLTDIDLVGQEVVKFLGECEQAGMELRGCPAYIRHWITQERNGGNSK